MSEGHEGQWFWCRDHERVERWPDVCAAHLRLGPYATEEAARRWKETAEARNEAWEDEDEKWEAWPDESPGSG